MLTRQHSPRSLVVPSLLCIALLSVGCGAQDNDLGKDSEADGGADANASDLGTVTCEQDGRSYQVGASVSLSACRTCVCQADGTMGSCTDLCGLDAATPDATVTCTRDGKTYPVGARTGSGCASCACLSDGTWGMCMGDCPPDAAQPDTAKQDVVAAEAMPANYTCRDDSDCCTVVDSCMAVAYLYSKAPGASGPPNFPLTTTGCLRCIPPAVQVRCDQGQCVGEKLPAGAEDNYAIRQSHCGTIEQPDAGAMIYTPAYAGAQPTSWGC